MADLTVKPDVVVSHITGTKRTAEEEYQQRKVEKEKKAKQEQERAEAKVSGWNLF